MDMEEAIDWIYTIQSAGLHDAYITPKKHAEKRGYNPLKHLI